MHEDELLLVAEQVGERYAPVCVGEPVILRGLDRVLAQGLKLGLQRADLALDLAGFGGDGAFFRKRVLKRHAVLYVSVNLRLGLLPIPFFAAVENRGNVEDQGEDGYDDGWKNSNFQPT